MGMVTCYIYIYIYMVAKPSVYATCSNSKNITQFNQQEKSTPSEGHMNIQNFKISNNQKEKSRPHGAK